MSTDVDNKAKWIARAKAKRVFTSSIYDVGSASLNSASKVQERQYLALRTIWKQMGADKFRADKWGITLRAEAQDELDKHPSLREYLAQLQRINEPDLPVRDLGSFSLVWHYQRLVQNATGGKEAEPKIIVSSPVSSRTRNQLNTSPTLKYSKGSEGVADDLDLLGKRMADIGVSDDDDDDNDEDEEEEDEQAQPQYTAKLSPFTPASREEARALYPPVEDEQIVNTCLINLLTVISFHSAKIKSHWSLRRKAFRFGDAQNKLYEARTDGFLSVPQGGSSATKAILEVKPYVRNIGDKLRLQETAQMAAWICAEPDVKTTSSQYRRVMVSQDRHEIYIIIAEYDYDYVEYVRNISGSKNKLSLMTMNQFGPFNQTSKDHMARLAHTIVALMLQGGKLEVED